MIRISSPPSDFICGADQCLCHGRVANVACDAEGWSACSSGNDFRRGRDLLLIPAVERNLRALLCQEQGLLSIPDPGKIL